MSIDELADAVKMDKGNLSKLERGKLPYNQRTLEPIAAALRVDVAALLRRAPSEPTSIYEYVARADPSVRRMIEAAAEAIFNSQKG